MISAVQWCVSLVCSTLIPGSSYPNLLVVGCIDYNEKLTTFNIANGFLGPQNTVSNCIILLFCAIFGLIYIIKQLSKSFNLFPSPLKDPPQVRSVTCKKNIQPDKVHCASLASFIQKLIHGTCNNFLVPVKIEKFL